MMSGDDRRNDDDRQIGVVVKSKPKTKKPSMYKVLLLNDDYTPMEFVVHVLERFFGKSREEATQIMLHVHRRGVGVCGVFTYEVAETKVTQVIDFARRTSIRCNARWRRSRARCCRPISRRRCTGRSPMPMSAGMNSRRSSISCWR